MTLTPASIVEQLGGAEELGESVDSGHGASVDWLRLHGLPTSHDEAWKYSPLKDLLVRPVDRLATVEDGNGIDTNDAHTILASLRTVDDEVRVILVDGVFRPDLSQVDDIDGLEIVSASEVNALDLSDGAAGLSVGGRVDGFQMLNRGLAPSEVFITVAAGSVIERPVHVIHISSGAADALLVQPHVRIKAGQHSQLTVIETFVGSSANCFVNALTSVEVCADALMRHYKLQAQALGSVHLSSVTVHQDRGSTLEAGAFSFGASIARNAIDVVAAGDRTTSNLFGLYLPKGSQQIDNVVTVEHAANNGASNQVYKGVIDDHARGAFSGHIIVDHGTVGTDAHQHNKSLLLDPVAQSDSRPWLEIFADDVACTHGSAIGQLDPDSLFYLQSRGIPLDDARSILVGGFINEVIDRVADQSIRDQITSLVKDQVRSRFTAELGGEH